MTTERMEKTLSRQSSITLGLMILVLGVALSATWWLAHLDAWTERTDARLESIEAGVREGTTHRWRGASMVRWAERLQEKNPALDVPQPILRNE
jgi:hypothetical protein